MFSVDVDPYEVLGISHGASEMDIRRARRKLILKYPNELFPERAQEINEAYQQLVDKQKRRRVDAFLASKAGSALRVQKSFLSDEVHEGLLGYPDRAKVFELFKLDGPIQVARSSLIEGLLLLTEASEEQNG